MSTDHSTPVPSAPQLARLARIRKAHPGYQISYRWYSYDEPVRYEAHARGDLSAHPYAVVTDDLAELAASLGESR
jgi:hypothetical protein